MRYLQPVDVVAVMAGCLWQKIITVQFGRLRQNRYSLTRPIWFLAHNSSSKMNFQTGSEDSTLMRVQPLQERVLCNNVFENLCPSSFFAPLGSLGKFFCSVHRVN